jgi:hypothetical protein
MFSPADQPCRLADLRHGDSEQADECVSMCRVRWGAVGLAGTLVPDQADDPMVQLGEESPSWIQAVCEP